MTEQTPAADPGIEVKLTHPDDESKVEHVRLFGHTRDTIEEAARVWLAEGRRDARWHKAGTEIVGQADEPDDAIVDDSPPTGPAQPLAL